MLLMLYCLLCFPHSQEGIRFTCTVCGVQGQCWQRPLGKVQIFLLYTHSHTAQIQPPAHPHTLPCILHGRNTQMQPSAHSCHSLLSPEWMWQHSYLTLCGNARVQAQRKLKITFCLGQKLYLGLHLESQDNPMKTDSSVHQEMKTHTRYDTLDCRQTSSNFQL